ncbi:hypothetical protein CERSUDRAFT_118805 [Gelatoporia subvermispora B]|uniref:Uncharacterized protein n=1 Tax=Ceriporiopsis subvermispora (strain B) TaxID=914234 RepID=M2Q6N3_CERS8|nr:hypothetical protein CERSUDRAFT_118805 [Gelatoporia subvermispora B]
MALVWFELYDEPILLNLIHSLYILAGINRPWPIAIASPKIWPIFTGIARKIVDKWTADIEDPSATGRAIIDLVHCALFLDIFSFTPVELSRLRGLASHDTRIITSLASTCSYVFATVWQRRSLFPLRGALPSHF